MGLIKRILQKPIIKNYETNKQYQKTILAIKGERYRERQEKQLSRKNKSYWKGENKSCGVL